MKIRTLHRWDLNYPEAAALQNRLRRRIDIRPLSLSRIHYVAGADLAVDKRLGLVFAAVVVMKLPSLEVVERRTASDRLRFPYVPGFLSFREIPGLARCLVKVSHPVDVVLCDGQGIAHPRGFGLASHLGVLLGTPSIGCAKSRFVGEHGTVGRRRGDFSRLMFERKQIGSVLRTQDGINPIFVSPGHLVDHPSSRRIVLACTSRYRLPEPTRLADRLAGEAKRRRSEAV